MIIPAYFDTHIAVLLILSLISLGLSAISTRVTWRLYKQSKALENMATRYPPPDHGHHDPAVTIDPATPYGHSPETTDPPDVMN